MIDENSIKHQTISDLRALHEITFDTYRWAIRSESIYIYEPERIAARKECAEKYNTLGADEVARRLRRLMEGLL